MTDTILAILLTFAPHPQDVTELPTDRAERLRPVAVAIDTAARDTIEAAFLVTQALHESRLARYVQEDRCSDGPVGERCDAGRARGVWQVHHWCTRAWDQTLPESERLLSGAYCSLRGWRWGYARCGAVWRVGFDAQLGRPPLACDRTYRTWDARVRTMHAVLRQLGGYHP